MDAVAEEEDDAWFLQTLEQELENELEEGEEETVTRIVDEVPQASSRQGGQGGAETEIETKSKSIASILEESSAALAAEVAKVADVVEVEKEDRDSVARERVVVSLVDDEPSPSGRITTTEPQKRGPFKRPGRKRARTDKQGFRPPSSTIPSLPTEEPRKANVAPSSQQLYAKVVNETCPPHPGFLRGLCIRCGQLAPQSLETKKEGEQSISLRYLHSDLEINKEYVRELKDREALRLIGQKKLSLVFDLDHTLLNSSQLKDITEAEMPLLENVVKQEAEAGKASLFLLNHIHMWTKLRPYYSKLLEDASQLFDMHVYTMGERGYALEMVKLLDPTGTFFGDHIVSKNDSISNSVKDLDVLIGSEKSVLILDDSPKVWHKHRANVLEVERYHFFPSSLRHFGISGKCLLERENDEKAEQGPLCSVWKMLKEIHEEYFSHPNPEQNDVREILKAKKRKVLVNCKVCFSRVFPKDQVPEQHPLWQLAEDFGATCTETLDEAVTHVVTTSLGTQKAIEGRKMGKYVVRPEWLHASVYHFKKGKEARYSLIDTEAEEGEVMASQE